MKISFNSAKEAAPTRHEGIEVLYGPGKRMAFKLRWYVLLLLVMSPLLILVGKVLVSVLLVEAPGKVVVPLREVFSSQTGIVQGVLVEKDKEVGQDQVMVQLSNADVALRIQTLQTLSDRMDNSLKDTQNQQLNLLRQHSAQARKWFEVTKAMKADGVLTQMEESQSTQALLKSQTDLIQAQIEYANANKGQDDVRDAQVLELQAMLEKDKAMTIKAPYQGTVVDVAVKPGQAVNVGDVIARIHTTSNPTVLLYLNPDDADLAVPGQKLSIKLPTGNKVMATIQAIPQQAVKMPAEFKEAFSSNQMGVLVDARLDQALPQGSFIDQLPVTASFPITLDYLKHIVGLRPSGVTHAAP